MKHNIKFLCFCCLLFVSPINAAPYWQLIPEKSELQFVFEQAGSDEAGKFKQFSAVFKFDPADLANSKFEVEVDMNSVDSGDEERDTILRSADMFDVKAWPKALFSTRTMKKKGDAYEAEADLTIHNVTRKILFPFTLKITQSDKGKIFHLQSEVKINRLDYSVGQGDWAETTWVSDEVVVKVDVYAQEPLLE